MIGLDSYSRQVFNYFDPILIYISLWFDPLFLILKIALCFLWLSLPGHYRVTDEALLAETTKYDPSSFLWMFSLLLKELIFYFHRIRCKTDKNRPFILRCRTDFMTGSIALKCFGLLNIASNQLTLKCTTPIPLVLNASPDVTTP